MAIPESNAVCLCDDRCGNMNFARRDTCNRCQTPRSGDSGDSEYSLCLLLELIRD